MIREGHSGQGKATGQGYPHRDHEKVAEAVCKFAKNSAFFVGNRYEGVRVAVGRLVTYYCLR